jgi:hypothetical protein
MGSLNTEVFGWKVLASSDSEKPKPTEPVIDASTQRDVVYHKGKVFEIPSPLLFYFRDTNMEAFIQRANELGLHNISNDGLHGCMYCAHSPKNFGTMASELAYSGKGMIIDNNVDFYGRCRFKCGDTKVATTTTHIPTGINYMLQRQPCVTDAAMVQVLYEKGLLDKYQVHREFDYPTREQLEKDSAAREKFRIGKPSFWQKVLARWYGHKA